MKNIFICLALLLFCLDLYSQNWIWSKKISSVTHYGNQGLLSDKYGKVYAYGSKASYYNYYDLSEDTLGSVLECYSEDGILLFEKHWKFPFHIRKMVYDGNDFLFFAGDFYKTIVIDGITISSNGTRDGVTGKMDLNGNILWMNTFGAGGNDMAAGICYNRTDSSVYVTGNINDSLIHNNAFISFGQQSAIILNYSPSGSLIRHKIYDFLPERNGHDNSGNEIESDLSGHIFVLMDREGRYWGGDTIDAPPAGRYVIKMDYNLDTLWTTFIISGGCYYGWSCHGLRIAANGDAYITSECSGKYGGTAKLLRLNGNNGMQSWVLLNQDGYYSDLFIDSNTVYLIGIEGANGCPCEGSKPGYGVIKKIDENNANVYHSNGTYVDTLKTKYGSCDSIITTHLTVLQPTAFSGSYFSIGGDQETSTCDSLFSLKDEIGGEATMRIYPNPSNGNLLLNHLSQYPPLL